MIPGLIPASFPLMEQYWLRLEFLPPLLARIALGVAFLASGTRKFGDIPGNTKFFRDIGVPASKANVYFVSSVEVLCGALVLVGLFTRLAALPLIPVMLVAIWTTKRKELRSLVALTGVFEFCYIILLLYLAVYGAGAISIDYWWVH